MDGIRWYSTARDLSTQERGPVDLPAALAVVDQYFERLKPGYSAGEEALSETMSGFSRGDADLIEICLHAANRISLTVEFPPGRSLIGRLRGTTRRELSLDSRNALRHFVTAYFTMGREEFKAQVAATRGS